MANGKTILVAGATGRQGGAAARHLLADGWAVRALTRDSSKPEAMALAEIGAEVVEGDMGVALSLAKAAKGVYGVFSVQTPWAAGIAAEVAQGRTLADAAAAAGVEHFVYASVGGAERQTGVPHFDSKWLIEEHVRSLGLRWTVLRPVFFMENLLATRDEIADGKLVSGVHPGTRLQMVAVDDIGAFVAAAFGRPDEFTGRAIELAGDEMTPLQMAQHLGAFLGRPVGYVGLSIDDIRATSEDYASMVQWFNEHGYEADIASLRQLYPPLKTLDRWLHEAWPR